MYSKYTFGGRTKIKATTRGDSTPNLCLSTKQQIVDYNFSTMASLWQMAAAATRSVTRSPCNHRVNDTFIPITKNGLLSPRIPLMLSRRPPQPAVASWINHSFIAGGHQVRGFANHRVRFVFVRSFCGVGGTATTWTVFGLLAHIPLLARVYFFCNRTFMSIIICDLTQCSIFSVPSTQIVFPPVQHKRLLKYAKGYRGRSKNCFTVAIRRVEKAWQYAYRDRKVKKRMWRTLWIQRLSAAGRQYNLTYSRLIAHLRYTNISLNRKVLSELAATEPFAFKSVVDLLQLQNRNYVPSNKV